MKLNIKIIFTSVKVSIIKTDMIFGYIYSTQIMSSLAT